MIKIFKIFPSSNRAFVFYHLLILSFALLLLISNLTNLYYSCINANDFSIYQQAIYKLSLFKDFNPFTSIRDLPIFSDHFDPIIFLPAIIIRLTDANPFILFIFEWSIWILFIVLIYKLGKYQWNSLEWIKALTVIVFSKSLLSGLDFPIHPTTWSMIPLLFLAYHILNKNNVGIFLSALSLLLFKELFVFMIIGLSGYYLLSRNFKLFFSLFITGVIGYWFIFIKRPELFGSNVNYGNSLLSSLLKNPVSTLWSALINFNFPWLTIIPSFLLIKKNRLKDAVPLFFFVLPGFLIHILGARIVHHHSVALTSAFLAFGLLSSPPHMLIVLLFLITGMGRHTRSFKNLFTNNFKTCKHDSSKLNSIEKAKEIIQPLPENKIVLASNGIIPRILSTTNTVFQIDNFTLPRAKYDYLVLEKNNMGDIWPYSYKLIDGVRDRCHKQATKVHLDNEFITIIEGNFTQECVQLNSFVELSDFRKNLINSSKKD